MDRIGKLNLLASLERPASMECWNELLEFAHTQIDLGISDKSKAFGMKLAIEELLSNIIKANSGCNDCSQGQEVKIEVASFNSRQDNKNLFVLRTVDSGQFYNPHFDSLADQIPDIPIEQRPVGGLGLFLVKTSVDSAHYAYADGHNTYHLVTETD
ncbi:ATP-binding protein [Cyanobium sp. CH-040]|uniref:ATP-binding protein n=1 Tax=Cyanobium sp. CH-040 TaxID=2823708 RepID=UPI0020CDBC06|nr:ATP-binding protein [Cyanobium sp. CH-040]MCP9928365.1 ATP-binding protein [Cyanobium sp. CH-040]